MAKVYNFRAPESMRLADMPTEKAERYASELADRHLELLGETAPIGVNAISLDQMADTEVWVQWTRACCDRRDRIDDFVDPIVREFDVTETALPTKLHGSHIESQMRTVRLESPKHTKAPR